MKVILKYVAVLFLLLASGRAALAGTLNGAINFAGAGQSNSTGITFQPPPVGGQSITAPSASGDFATYQQGQAANFTNNFTFAGISQAGGEQLFKVQNTDMSMQLAFVVTSYSTLPDGKLLFTGTLTEYAYNSTTGRGAIIGSSSGVTLIYSNSGATSFSAQLTTAPEPNSLILLGTGLVSAAGMMTRRRRAARA